MRRILDARFKNFRNDARQHDATLWRFAFLAGGCQPGCSDFGDACPARGALSQPETRGTLAVTVKVLRWGRPRRPSG